MSASLKPRTDLLPAGALLEVARVLAHGAAKHGERGWGRRLYGADFGAALRHLWAWWRGEERDPESGCSHLAHAAARILILLDRLGWAHELDDRPGAGR